MTNKGFRGRQKIKMAKIENPNHRQATFSKRRSGVFNKAYEICTFCGVESIVIVFSPSQKIYSFGHPNIESVMNRYFTHTSCPQKISTSTKVESAQVPQNSTIQQLNSELNKISDLLEAERNKREVLNNLRKSSQWWWETPIDELGLHELEILDASMNDLRKNIENQTIFLQKTTLSSISSKDHDVVVFDQPFGLKSIDVKNEENDLSHQCW